MIASQGMYFLYFASEEVQYNSIRAILLLSVVMSFVMWVGSDDVLVKQITIPVKIAKVSSKLHRSLDVDAVALVGDMVDGPVKILANRMEPLWSALKRHHTYFVSGNHEYYYGDAMMWFVEYEIHGVRVLNNRSAAAL
ncbi:hypothetical protein OSTOST_19169, partial [Ostertagia ostertagi]